MEIAVVLLVALLVVIYFFPAIVAAARGHRNANAICLANLFFGWTGIGWCGTLVWAMCN